MIGHPILEKRGADNISGQIFHGFFKSGQNARPGEYIESRMSPFVQQPNHFLRDLSLCQKHLQYFVTEYLLQGLGVNGLRNGKHAVCVETSIGNQYVQVELDSYIEELAIAGGDFGKYAPFN